MAEGKERDLTPVLTVVQGASWLTSGAAVSYPVVRVPSVGFRQGRRVPFRADGHLPDQKFAKKKKKKKERRKELCVPLHAPLNVPLAVLRGGVGGGGLCQRSLVNVSRACGS